MSTIPAPDTLEKLFAHIRLQPDSLDRKVDARDIREAIALLERLQGGIHRDDSFGISHTLRSLGGRLLNGKPSAHPKNGFAGQMEKMFGLDDPESNSADFMTQLENVFLRPPTPKTQLKPDAQIANPEPRTSITPKHLPENGPLEMNSSAPGMSRRTFLSLMGLTGGVIATNPAAALAKMVSVGGKDLFAKGMARLHAFDMDVGIGKLCVAQADSLAAGQIYGTFAHSAQMMGITRDQMNQLHYGMHEFRPEIISRLTSGLQGKGKTFIDILKKHPHYYGSPAQWNGVIEGTKQLMPVMKAEMQAGLSETINGLKAMLENGSYAMGDMPMTVKGLAQDLEWAHIIHERALLRPGRIAAHLSHELPGYDAVYDEALLSEMGRWKERIQEKILPLMKEHNALRGDKFSVRDELERSREFNERIAELRARGKIPAGQIDAALAENQALHREMETTCNRIDPEWRTREWHEVKTQAPDAPISDEEFTGQTHGYAARILAQRQEATPDMHWADL